jgi:hypothetical protein
MALVIPYWDIIVKFVTDASKYVVTLEREAVEDWTIFLTGKSKSVSFYHYFRRRLIKNGRIHRLLDATSAGAPGHPLVVSQMQENLKARAQDKAIFLKWEAHCIRFKFPIPQNVVLSPADEEDVQVFRLQYFDLLARVSPQQRLQMAIADLD